MLAGACGFQGSPGNPLIFCLHKQQSWLLRGGLLSRGNGGCGFDCVEPFEWKLAFASSGTVQRGLGELRGWEALSGCSSGNPPGCVREDGATSLGEEAEGLPPPVWQLSGACAHGRQTCVVSGGPRGLRLGIVLNPGAVIALAATSLISWNRKSA